MAELDRYDALSVVGVVVIVGGLLWIHPGLLVAAIGAALLMASVRQ